MSRPLSYLSISRSALRHNALAIRSLLGPHQQLCAVVKANAYGHGLAQVVEAVDDLVDAFQVDDIEELRTLRSLTTKRALVLGFIQPSELEVALQLDAEIAVYDTERLRAVRRMATPEKPAKIHLKIDAYLGRQGVLPKLLEPLLPDLKHDNVLQLCGVYTHFSNLEDTTSTGHADAQLAAFGEACALLERHGITPPQHTSSSAGIMRFEGAASPRQLARLGISLYGYYPSPHFAEEFQQKLALQPVLRWISHLAQVKELPEGHPVGYGLSYIAPHPIRMAVVPQGYSDGYPRHLSNLGHMLVSGVPCPVIGRVAMNMIAIDVSAVPTAKAGNEVILLGHQHEISAEALASNAGTISYEILARLNPLLPRFLQ
jgi:alanine racemase